MGSKLSGILICIFTVCLLGAALIVDLVPKISTFAITLMVLNSIGIILSTILLVIAIKTETTTKTIETIAKTISDNIIKIIDKKM